MREAFAAVEAALMGGNGSRVATDFSCCQIPNDRDDQVMALWEKPGLKKMLNKEKQSTLCGILFAFFKNRLLVQRMLV